MGTLESTSDPLRSALPRRWRRSKSHFLVGETGLFFRVAGGGKRDRTADLLHAMQALSQLSYTPARKKRHYRRARFHLKAATPDYFASARVSCQYLVSRGNRATTASTDGSAPAR